MNIILNSVKCGYRKSVILKLRKKILKVAILIQIELTFLLIMIEILGLWHFKAQPIVDPNSQLASLPQTY